MTKYLNLEYNPESKSRDLNMLLIKLFNSTHKYVVSISSSNLLQVYNSKGQKQETITEKLNSVLKNTVNPIDIIALLKKYGVEDKTEELQSIPKETRRITNSPDSQEVIKLGEMTIKNSKNEDVYIEIYYNIESKSVIIDSGFIFKEIDNDTDEEVLGNNSSDNTEGKMEAPKIILSDDIDYKHLEKLRDSGVDLKSDKRQIMDCMPYLIDFCLHNDIGDITLSCEDLPYFIKGESIINKEELTNIIGEIFGHKKLTNEELRQFTKASEQVSKSDNVLEDLEKDFIKGGDGYVDYATLINGVKQRVNVAYKGGKKISIVLRVIKSGLPPKMEDLGLIDSTTTAYKDVLTQPFGLILIVGPTGSGKSYSLTSMLGEINTTQYKRIITLEDPVEFEHIDNLSKIEQREVGVDVSTYKAGLKASLRQKPHMIVCGEIRDQEVMELALEAASTGHVVFATFHANDVIQTIQRIMQMFPLEQQESLLQQLSELLLGVFVQKLVPRKGGGKVLIKEIMVNNKSIRKAIKGNEMKALLESINQGSDLGMISNDNSIKKLFKEGKITDHVAYEYASNKEHIANYTNYDKYET